jgi:hypothetical protein
MNVQRNSDVDAYNARIEDINTQHQAVLDSITPPQTYSVLQNTSDQPETFDNGVICMPGDYYIEGDNPQVIAADEFSSKYTEVTS